MPRTDAAYRVAWNDPTLLADAVLTAEPGRLRLRRPSPLVPSASDVQDLALIRR